MKQITTENHSEKSNTEPFALLSDSQWRFVTTMLGDPSLSKKEAAELCGLSHNTVYGWGKHVDEAIRMGRESIHAAALARRKQAVLKAISVKTALLDSDDENVRSKAATEIIEWELGRATSRQEITGANGGAIEVKQTWADIFALPSTDGDGDGDPFA